MNKEYDGGPLALWEVETRYNSMSRMINEGSYDAASALAQAAVFELDALKIITKDPDEAVWLGSLVESFDKLQRALEKGKPDKIKKVTDSIDELLENNPCLD